MAVPQVNGDVSSAAPASATIQHIVSYPVVSDSIDAFKSNPYGQQSLKLGWSVYQTFATPVVPYLSKPYGYVSSYISKADALGDQTLDRIDQRLPVVKKPTGEIYNEARSYLLWPLAVSKESRDHVYNTYNSEVKKNEQQGLVGQTKAAVSTVLVVSHDTLSWISSLLTAKKAEAAEVAKQASEKIQQ